MKKISLLLTGLFALGTCFAQVNEREKITELGKAYKSFCFRNAPPKNTVKDLELNTPPNLKQASSFVVQSLLVDNDLLKTVYLDLPEQPTLKYIYLIRAVFLNLASENPANTDKLLDSLSAANIPRNELVDTYYSMLFTAVGNKNQPFNFSKCDFKLKEYHLSNDTEKGIFFLRCMDFCGSTIWGYMNIVKPPNTKEAGAYLKRFPKINGLAYYQFDDFSFPDFDMTIIQNKGKQSYKEYYINKYYELLLSHLVCMNANGAKEKEKTDLLLGSILKDKNLYKYTKHKDTLESLFQVQN